MQDIQKFLGQAWTDFQLCFTESLKSDIPLLEKANRFILGHGGKKLRPTFTLLIAKALRGACNEHVVRCGTPSELLHTATLMHDDVADNSPTRRGVPSVMAAYSPTTAVLLGDYWLSRAMDLIIDHPDKRVLHAFSKCLGDLARGEMLQLERSRKVETTEEDYLQIIYCKTTSLFEASVLSAAYSVDASDEEVEACRAYACHVGQAFQMRDDMLDYSPDLSIGKPVGQDIMESKVTLPLLGFFRKAPQPLVREVRRRMKKPDASLVSDAIALVREYGGLDYARERINAEIDVAVAALDRFADSPARAYLEKLAHMVSVRTV
ncbi:MAG: polyprenyl synthetase family protein [Bacteroidales bacterium]|nr:polyprenyl synthetase family protein [Bacteroidales bacterium]